MKTPQRIELSNVGSKATNNSKHRKMGISDVTIAKDSQESILGSENGTSVNGNGAAQQNDRGMGWIQRTDDVTIAYEPKVGERNGI
jgi:hypothetical protein